ncbi:hypothetical protein SAMN05192568_1003253 [Methylobacterium pseudosasicola]|uniref:Uncharacterized protein n=1 Tax=Methylobacterium pseudosasicola TaxID=582667 RepID=A0A1I4GUR1_9HYPH|nr:hypothetical protein SAMN05192568_1003253 [Methylobacterium pseudosasicola]
MYGGLDRITSGRCLERENPRDIELTGRPMPGVETLADFRKDNSPYPQRGAALAPDRLAASAAALPAAA